MNKKGRKTAEKKCFDQLSGAAITQSWSKYTTHIYINSINEFNSNSEEDFRILMKR